MKREIVLDLLELVSENLDRLSILHTQIVVQVQEMVSSNLQQERTLQEIRQQLIKRGKYLNTCYRHQKRIFFQIEENQVFWFFKRKRIVDLLKQYNWDSPDKIEANFQDSIKDYSYLEKQLCDWRYSLLKIEKLNGLIQGNLLDEFVQLNQENEDNCDNIDRVISTYNLMAEYALAKRNQELNLDYLQSLRDKVLALGKEEKLAYFQAASTTI